MKIFLLLAMVFVAFSAMAQTTPACFFQTAHDANGQLYSNNPITFDDTHNGSAYGTQIAAQYQINGTGGVLADGPSFYVTTPCVIDRIAYRTGDISHTDSYYRYHYVCGAGANINQGDTINTTPATPGGQCASGYDVALVNTYDVGVYCEGGSCTYGKLYANLGPIPYNVFYAGGPQQISALFFRQGPVVLPSGTYGMLQGGNCDSGSIPNTSQGTGNINCGMLYGEIGPDTSSPSGPWNGFANEFYPHKVFTMGSGTTGAFHCLIYDPAKNNSIGLPPSYTAYDGGGCTIVNTGTFLPSTNVVPLVTNSAPHAAHMAIMGTAQSIVTAASKINPATKLTTGTSIH